jgi:hypothetical protein
MAIDPIQFATQLALLAVGGVSTWSIWVTKRHMKLKRDLDAAFFKIREIEKELNRGGYSSENAGCPNCQVDD